MKKYFLLGLIVAIAPNICFGAGARYTQLVREKQRKMEELEKCMGSSKGLKIAGLSTIGLTAVGVAGNIAEAQKLQEYDDAIAKKNKDIETKEKAIVAENEKIKKIEAEKKAAEEAAKKKAEEKAAAGHLASGTGVGKLNLSGLNKNVNIATQRGMDAVFGNNTRLYIPVPAAPTFVNGGNGDGATAIQGSGSVPPVNNNNDLTTGKPGTSASGQDNGSATKTTTNVKKFRCEDSGGNWIGDKCQCMDGFNVDYEGKCFRLLDGIGITVPRKSDDNNPNMLKNVVERDIAAINATTAKLGAKIYVSGYPASLVPGVLGWELVDAYTDFNDRCGDLGEGYSFRPVDDRATGFGDELDLNTILTDTTPYALSECWCFTEEGYEKQGDKCVKK